MKVSVLILKNLFRRRQCLGCGSYMAACGFLCFSCWRILELRFGCLGKTVLAPASLWVRPLFDWQPGRSDLLSNLILAHKGSSHEREWDWIVSRWHLEQGRAPVRVRDGSKKKLIFIPVPSPTNRKHAFELAHAFARSCGGEVRDCLRVSGHPGIKQQRLNRFERSRRTIELLEEFTTESVENAELILIDDVVTTGSTALACQAVLGLSRMEVWCLAYRSRLAASS